jgi:hypothetical protein
MRPFIAAGQESGSVSRIARSSVSMKSKTAARVARSRGMISGSVTIGTPPKRSISW